MKKAAKKAPRKVTKRSPFKARGVSKIALVAIVAVVLAGAGGIFFFTQKGEGGAITALPFVKPALNPNCKYNDPDLCKFVNNFPTQTNYRVSSTGTFDGMTSESIYEMSGDSKFHMVSKLDGKENLNTITIGDTTYTLDYTDNKWWKQTYKPDDATKSTAEEIIGKNTFKEESVEDNTSYKFIAKEPCANLTCFKYEMISPDSADTKVYIWFDDREYLMRKMRFEDKSDMANESVYSYETISIAVPSPVKEGTPDNFGGMPAEVKNEEIQKMMKEYQEQGTIEQSGFDSGVPVEYNAPEEY